ncbi:MAG: orotate phosphoribosyltransferase [Candidatus Omnitrophota bacterium]
MTQDEILGIFEKSGALLEGHFLLSSGLHSPRYLQCALILQDPLLADKVCAELAEKFDAERPTLIMGPALGGIIVAYEVGKTLGVRAIFAERTEGKLNVRRGFSISPKDRVLVVEDVVTTGGSTKEVIELVKNAGAQLVGAGAIVDRSEKTPDFGVKFKALLKINIPTYQPQNCPLCKKGSAPVKPGSRNIK